MHAQFIVLIAFDQEEGNCNFFDFAAKAGITDPNEKKVKVNSSVANFGANLKLKF